MADRTDIIENVEAFQNTFDGLDELAKRSNRGRKRKTNPTETKRAKEKRFRHSGHGKEPSIACNHGVERQTPNFFCQAFRFDAETLKKGWNKFYSDETKETQDHIISNLIKVLKATRVRVTPGARQKRRSLTIKYSLKNYGMEGAPLLPVCKSTFLSALGMKKDRVLGVAERVYDNGTPGKEKRGGARDTPAMKERKEAVRLHIESFHCRASHYSRKDNPGRKYLPSEMNVSRMHSMFESQSHHQISYSLYYSVFREDFNLGFGHPSTDKCSTCEKYSLQIQDSQLTREYKLNLTGEFILHRRKARKFYDDLNLTSTDSITICFDMMENQLLPKTPIGQAYYSRQLYLYIFGVVRHRGRDAPQMKEDIFFYTWLESENRKNSNMISSALHHCFSKRAEDIQGKTTLKLFSDSCYGQNKNFNVLSMLTADRKNMFPNTKITYTFPVRGHSYLPADRAFGRVSQSIRQRETVFLPEEYIEILSRHGTVFQYGKDWHSYDYKTETSKFLKQKRDFQISHVKRIKVADDKVSVSDHYNGELSQHSILKRGKSWATFSPQILEKVSSVKDVKKNDVLKLLSVMGVSDIVKERYNEMFRVASDGANNSESDSD